MLLNIDALMDYIRENFTLDGTSQALVHDALAFADTYNCTPDGAVEAAIYLIGSIGINEAEIEMFAVNEF